jgi:hypothetical protein
LKGEICSQLTLERCNDQQLALGDHSAFIHPGAETEIRSLGNNLTEYKAIFLTIWEKQVRDASSHEAEARVCQNRAFARWANQGLYRSFDCYIFNILERQRVVATLLQLHNKVS